MKVFLGPRRWPQPRLSEHRIGGHFKGHPPLSKVRCLATGRPWGYPARMDWRALITSDAQTLHGQVRVAGTRIPVSVVLDNLAAGMSEAEILSQYPTLSREAVRACLAYAAELAREEILPLTGT